MSPVRASDLPAEVRKRLGLDNPSGGRERPSRAGVGLSEPCPGKCGCGARFGTAAAWERHAKQTGHRVWAIDLKEVAGDA